MVSPDYVKRSEGSQVFSGGMGIGSLAGSREGSRFAWRKATRLGDQGALPNKTRSCNRNSNCVGDVLLLPSRKQPDKSLPKLAQEY